MKNKNLRIFAVFLLVMSSIIFTINVSSITFYSLKKQPREINTQRIKNSATNDTIIIQSPEDKTYTVPMAGYYPATYGFENDEDESSPDDWINTCQQYSYAKIISELGGHNKVLECYSGTQTQSCVNLRKYYNYQINGIVEFWWRKSSTQPSAGFFHLYGDNNEDLIQICIDTQNDPNKIMYTGISGLIDTNYSYADDRWIHMLIDFNCASDTWSLWIDNVKYVNNVNFKLDRKAIAVNMTHIWSYDGAHATLFYIDAIGYSWDSNYNIGDNLKEGLLLSFENKTSLDWIGYSLDGQVNKTILGNSTIPMPEDGRHSIQVFGSDILGTMYESEVRYFSIGVEAPGIPIEIIIIVSVFGSIIVLIVVVFIFLRKRGKITAPKRFKIKSKRE